jgi:hypothetical protein
MLAQKIWLLASWPILAFKAQPPSCSVNQQRSARSFREIALLTDQGSSHKAAKTSQIMQSTTLTWAKLSPSRLTTWPKMDTQLKEHFLMTVSAFQLRLFKVLGAVLGTMFSLSQTRLWATIGITAHLHLLAWSVLQEAHQFGVFSLIQLIISTKLHTKTARIGPSPILTIKIRLMVVIILG